LNEFILIVVAFLVVGGGLLILLHRGLNGDLYWFSGSCLLLLDELCGLLGSNLLNSLLSWLFGWLFGWLLNWLLDWLFSLLLFLFFLLCLFLSEDCHHRLWDFFFLSLFGSALTQLLLSLNLGSQFSNLGIDIGLSLLS